MTVIGGNDVGNDQFPVMVFYIMAKTTVIGGNGVGNDQFPITVFPITFKK